MTVLRKIKQQRIRRGNINTFLFFLFFAVIIWVFVQFSKQYNEIVTIPVRYINVPPDKLLSPENPREIKLKMEENGFTIAWFSLFPPTFKVDVSKAAERNGKLYYVIDENRSDILAQLDIDFEENQFLKDALVINYNKKAEKKLPVLVNANIEYAVGFSSPGQVEIKPDSVMVSGPQEILDTISSLSTTPLALKKLSQDAQGIISIDTAHLNGISVYQNEVAYQLDVEKSTEGKVTVPIEVTNVPEGMNLVIFPKEVLLFYQVNLENYNKVSASDFSVVADFGEAGANQDFLIPKVVKKPEFTSNIRLNEKKIQFVIKK